MSGSTINATKYLKRQGIDPQIMYEAKVVNNNDPRKLGRLQARIKGLFDDIPDADLPWSNPEFQHLDGAFNDESGNSPKRSGTFFVAKNGSTVGIRFPTGDSHRSVWGAYTVDEKIALPERSKNYPDRAVFRFSNGCFLVIDTRTNEVFFNNPGDLNITIMGDVNQTIIGNQQLTVSDNKGEIPAYIMAAPDFGMSQMRAKASKKIPFLGLLSKGYAGNQHTTISGDQTVLVRGNKKEKVLGNYMLDVGKFTIIKSGVAISLKAPRIDTGAS